MPKEDIRNRMFDRFQTAGDGKKQFERTKELEKKVLSLEAELAGKNNTGKFLVDIDDLIASEQARKTFTNTVIVKRMRSFQAEGQIEPLTIILHPTINGKYLIEDGEIRWRAAQKLVENGNSKWQQLEAVLSSKNYEDDVDVNYISLLHNLHSEAANALDKAESILKEAVKLGFEKEEAIKIFRAIGNKLARDKSLNIEIREILNSENEIKESELINSSFTPDQIVLLLLLFNLQIDMVSFGKGDLNSIFFADDLKQAVRNRDLSCNQAILINKISSSSKKFDIDENMAVKLRNQVVNRVLEESMTIKNTRNYVEHEIMKLSNFETKEGKWKKEVKKISKSFLNLDLETFPDEGLEILKNDLEVYLEQINKALMQ